MARKSLWVRPLVWMSAVLAMSVPLLASEGPGADDASAVRALLAAQEDAWNAGNIDGFLEAYDRQELVFASGGNIRRGWEELRERYHARYDTPEKMGTLGFTIEPAASNRALRVPRGAALGSSHASCVSSVNASTKMSSPALASMAGKGG